MITREHIEDLLRSRTEDPTLIVVEGHAVVVPASALDTDRHRGAVELISRDDLAARLGTDEPSPRDLDAMASRLDTMVKELGA